jgi:hypothetical protein
MSTMKKVFDNIFGHFDFKEQTNSYKRKTYSLLLLSVSSQAAASTSTCASSHSHLCCSLCLRPLPRSGITCRPRLAPFLTGELQTTTSQGLMLSSPRTVGLNCPAARMIISSKHLSTILIYWINAVPMYPIHILDLLVNHLAVNKSINCLASAFQATAGQGARATRTLSSSLT